MNQALFEKHYQEQLKLLPEISQQAISSFNWIGVLLDIGKSYALQLDELEDLQLETMMLLTGIASADEYESELSGLLPLSKIELSKLLGDVNAKILQPIHDYIINGGPITPGPMEQAGVNLVNEDESITTQNTSTYSPIRIDPLPVNEDQKLPTDPQKREDIIEHKLDDIFHETLEHVEHV